MPRGAREALQPVPAPAPPVPQRRRYSGGMAGRLSALFTFLLCLVLAAGGTLFYVQGLYTAPGPLAADKVIVIPSGSGSEDIAQLLQGEGVVDKPVIFQIAAIISRNAQQRPLRAGEYLIRQASSMRDVLETLVNGRVIQHSITIPEGLTSEQIVERLKENDILVGNVREVPREGTLLPETYKFERGNKREDILARMTAEHRRVLAEVWQRRVPDLPLKTPADLVILASIVEKETGRSDERTRVASVFVNRLNRNMKLESDPTIIYGLTSGKGALGRPILASEIRQPTPYNTYVINGLPPGPISNPGRASLEAVAMPSKTRDLFFVADGTGGHAFAETYEQHQRNVLRWRQIESQTTGQPPAAAPLPATPPPPAAAPRGQQRSQAPAGATSQPATASAFAVPELPANALINSGLTPDPADQPPLEPVETYPVSPGRRLSFTRHGEPVDLDGRGIVPQQQQLIRPNPRGDAVAGTARDPLRNRTYDLNSPQTVPPLPGLR